MQDFLTLAIDAIAAVSFVYFAAGFALIVSSHTASPIHPTAELPTQTEDDAVVAELHIEVEEPITSPSTLQPTLQPLETTTPDWSAIAPAQLRKECSARKIRWRNAAANGKHLKKREMVLALMGYESGIPEAM